MEFSEWVEVKEKTPQTVISRMSINMCQHPVYQVNVSRKEVLCAPGSNKYFGTPCL